MSVTFSVIPEKSYCVFCVLKGCPFFCATCASLKHILLLLFLSIYYILSGYGLLYPIRKSGHSRKKNFNKKKNPKKGSQRLEIVATLVEDISLLYVVVTNTVEDISMFSITKFLNPYCFHKFILL